jgi:type VI secretion system protein ImpM
MQCGLFGKLPSKRDFVSYNMPRPFLDHWEQWLQGAVAASRLALGESWMDIFLNAPLWRFWCGRSVFGQAATGALMPSVDGIGRYFPLSLCACEPEGTRLPLPFGGALDEWHAGCEQFLLRMLDDKLDAEPAALLETVPFVTLSERSGITPSFGSLDTPLSIWPGASGSLEASFRALEGALQDRLHDGTSYWWTIGGAAREAQLIALEGRPQPEFLTALMTGRAA